MRWRQESVPNTGVLDILSFVVVVVGGVGSVDKSVDSR